MVERSDDNHRAGDRARVELSVVTPAPELRRLPATCDAFYNAAECVTSVSKARRYRRRFVDTPVTDLSKRLLLLYRRTPLLTGDNVSLARKHFCQQHLLNLFIVVHTAIR